VAKKRSAIIPTIKGEIMAATPVAAYAVPLRLASTSSVPRYDHMGTYQTPQIKNWKNINKQKRTVNELFIGKVISFMLVRECVINQ
jgi:hypothetical protein